MYKNEQSGLCQKPILAGSNKALFLWSPDIGHMEWCFWQLDISWVFWQSICMVQHSEDNMKTNGMAANCFHHFWGLNCFYLKEEPAWNTYMNKRLHLSAWMWFLIRGCCEPKCLIQWSSHSNCFCKYNIKCVIHVTWYIQNSLHYNWP